MSSYKCMYVIPKEMYQRLIKGSSSQSSLNSVSSQSQITPPSPPPPPSGAAAAVVCSKDFKHPNILAHHRKSHVDGYQCNICKKVFNHQQELQKHLAQHAADTAKKYDDDDDVRNPKRAKVEDMGMESVAAAPAPPPLLLHCPLCKKPSKHKRNLARHIKSHDDRLRRECLNFTITANNKWLTLQ
jgi:C2H2-type zinc finger/Zinc finger, C2H2 type